MTELWAWITLDDGDGNEGVVGFRALDGAWHPLIGADQARISSLRPMAEAIARNHTNPIELRRFTTMTVEDTIPPGK